MVEMASFDLTVLPSQQPKKPKKRKLTAEEVFGSEIGRAWFFEHTVIYGSFQDVMGVFGEKSRKRILSKHGHYIGVVKGLIPVDKIGHKVLYEYHTSTAAYKKRKKIREFRRKHGIGKLEMRPTLARVRKKSGRMGYKTVEKQANIPELLK